MVIFYEDPNAPYADLANLLHQSFKERLDSNLNFGCASYNAKELEEKTQGKYIVVVFDGNKTIAMGALSIKMKHGRRSGIFEYLAVSPEIKYRRKGLGSSIMEQCIKIAQKQDCCIVYSCTAISAESSVRCHLKMGFMIYRVIHYSGRSYFSYVFFYPLKKTIFNLFLIVFRKPIYLFSKFMVNK